jgi:purine nucleoside permease
MVIDMFNQEGTSITGPFGLTDDLTVAGLAVHCNKRDICETVTGMGYANAAASTTALVYSPELDLTKTYFVIAGIAGVDPTKGTLGTAAWARYAVDFGYANEIDAREMPTGWPYGYFGIGTTGPGDPPPTDHPAFQLDEHLLQAALTASQGVTLTDSATAAATRAHYPNAPANQPPSVTQCDVVSSDTWFAGDALSQRARDWMAAITGGAGRFCMSAQEDSATLEVLQRAAAAGRLDFSRIALLRTASDFSAPYPGQTDADGLLGSLDSGGLQPSLQNLPLVAAPLATEIVNDWAAWQDGVPGA